MPIRLLGKSTNKKWGCICPFAGEITIDKKGYIHAEILIALPQSKDFVKERLATYAYDYKNYTE